MAAGRTAHVTPKPPSRTKKEARRKIHNKRALTAYEAEMMKKAKIIMLNKLKERCLPPDAVDTDEMEVDILEGSEGAEVLDINLINKVIKERLDEIDQEISKSKSQTQALEVPQGVDAPKDGATKTKITIQGADVSARKFAMPAIKRLVALLQVENGAAKSKTMIDSAETPRLAFTPAEKTANQPTGKSITGTYLYKNPANKLNRTGGYPVELRPVVEAEERRSAQIAA
ncbi:hypothetical protein K3495_g2333 [Podosphaera aphanis]|nr:hypothetical protein K3495_g2333 [Podosphaera aphanis]